MIELKAVQDFYQTFQEDMGWDRVDKHDYQSSKEFLLYIHMLLTTEVAEVAEEFRTMMYRTRDLADTGLELNEAYSQAKQEIRENLGKELADCLAYLCKLANFFEYDLEEELRAKLDEIRKKYNK
ncbi:MazG-like family protein [Paenibacillus sp. J2TS4]|uniref:MazG-like family protein n=1 Tax=Paenibacillus sp. J2TS4 TaxID=2807194 RepID=UPI0020C00E63|nr:MazG-like family protein [Paenibacillus sp. J2TS4]